MSAWSQSKSTATFTILNQPYNTRGKVYCMAGVLDQACLVTPPSLDNWVPTTFVILVEIFCFSVSP